MKRFYSFQPELHQKVLSSLLGDSPAASSAFSGTIHSRKLIKAFNQILVLKGETDGIKAIPKLKSFSA